MSFQGKRREADCSFYGVMTVVMRPVVAIKQYVYDSVEVKVESED